jgi:predicted metalloendopeptidase
MNGVTTQGENMADNGGMRQAFLAYKKYVENNGPDLRLPGLHQFSPEQLFFLGFATVSLVTQELTEIYRRGRAIEGKMGKINLLGLPY